MRIFCEHIFYITIDNTDWRKSKFWKVYKLGSLHEKYIIAILKFTVWNCTHQEICATEIYIYACAQFASVKWARREICVRTLSYSWRIPGIILCVDSWKIISWTSLNLSSVIFILVILNNIILSHGLERNEKIINNSIHTAVNLD